MRFDLTKPCKDCPFRSDIRPFLTQDRAQEIWNGLKVDHTFPCHKTYDYNAMEDAELLAEEEGTEADWRAGCHDKTMHCAGALILIEKEGRPGSMQQIAQRLGIYHPEKLDMTSPVYDSAEEWIAAQDSYRRGLIVEQD